MLALDRRKADAAEQPALPCTAHVSTFKQQRLVLFGQAQDRRAAEAAGVSLPPPKSPALSAVMETRASYTPDHTCVPGSRGAMCAGYLVNSATTQLATGPKVSL